MIVRSLRL